MIKFSNFYTLQYIFNFDKLQNSKWAKSAEISAEKGISNASFYDGVSSVGINKRHRLKVEWLLHILWRQKLFELLCCQYAINPFFLTKSSELQTWNEGKYRYSLKCIMDISKPWLFSAVYCRPLVILIYRNWLILL